MKRIVSLMLAVLLLFTCGSTFVFADALADAAEETVSAESEVVLLETDPSNTPPVRI